MEESRAHALPMVAAWALRCSLGHADRGTTNPGASFREQFLHSGGGVRCQEPTVDIAMDARTLGELKAITDIDDCFDTNGTDLTNTRIVEFTVLK